LRLDLGQSDGATLRAVYAFLDSIGCRFLAPHLDHYKGSAELVPKVKDLSISESHIGTFEPALSFRKLYVEEGHSHTPQTSCRWSSGCPRSATTRSSSPPTTRAPVA
jgi:hypothetical protein